ncbi:MAG: aspartate aminotransferase family protein, partial [Dehalococcoidia bacterium]
MNDDRDYQELIERDIAHVIHPQYLQGDQRKAIIIESGKGAVLTDVRGKEYIDGLSSLWNVAIGHGR